MIIEKLENLYGYLPENEHGDAVKAFLASNPLDTLSKGRHDIDELTYVNVLEYETKLPVDVKLEAHVKYVDVQVIISGEETAYYAELDGQSVAKQYDGEADYALYDAPENSEHLLKAGDFTVLFPNHLHAFGIAKTAPATVKKAVFKIPVWNKN